MRSGHSIGETLKYEIDATILIFYSTKLGRNENHSICGKRLECKAYELNEQINLLGVKEHPAVCCIEFIYIPSSNQVQSRYNEEKYPAHLFGKVK